MAPQMYPRDTPAPSASRSAEPAVYRRLSTTLSDEWTVIHSLRWLRLPVGQEAKRLPYSQGEIDFVLLHPSLGVHLIEVKGGTWAYNGKTSKFELIRQMQGQSKVLATRDVVGQARTNQFALRYLLQAFCQQLEISTPPFLLVGIFLLFPECDFDRRMLPPDIYDPSSGKKLVLGQPEMAYLGDAIEAGARTWKESFNHGWQGYRNSQIGKQLIQRLVAALRPIEGYQLRLARQIEQDQKHLELSPEQGQILSRLLREERAIVVGGSGTGKTLLLVEAARRLDKEGKKILLVTYNRLLADRLEKALKDVAKVMTYTQLRQAIAKQRGVITRSKVKLDQVIKKAFAEWGAAGSPHYNTLLIDEAQSFKPEWIKLLVDYYCDLPIYACHDEAQVFENRYTSEQELLALLGVAKPYQLSLNLRSPQVVFERLNQIEQRLIQRYSPRPPNPRMLREYLIDERHLLKEVTARLDDLADEGVAPEEIVILGEADRLRRMGLAHRVSALQNIRGFRGCEAPVVIVLWMGAHLDSAELRCAYARATTCTIVLFSQTALHGGAETQLGQALLADLNCISLHAALRTERYSPPARYQNWSREEEMVVQLQAAASCVVQDGVWLGWLPWQQGAWLLDGKRSGDGVTLRLWRDTLLVETKYPVYELKSRGLDFTDKPLPDNWALYLPSQQKKGLVYSPPLTYWVVNRWPCHNCGTTNAMRLPLPDGKSCCATCLPDKKPAQPPLRWKLQVQQWASSLHTAPSTAQTLLPLSLHALGHWRHSPASPSVYNLPDELTPLQAACRVWLLAVLTHLEAGQIFTLIEALQWLQWKSVNQDSWKQYIATMLNAIRLRVHGSQWAERIKGRTFRRTSAHPALIVKRNSIEYEMEEATLWAGFFANLDELAIYDPDITESTGGVGGFYLPRLEWWLVIATPEEVASDMETDTERDTLYLIGTPGEHQGWGCCSWYEGIPSLPYDSYRDPWNWTIQHGLLAVGDADAPSHPRLQMAYQAGRGE